MSKVGGCSRALAAAQLSYPTAKPPMFLELAATEGTRHEDWVADDLEKKYGWTLSPKTFCAGCQRWGHHVEIDCGDFILVGHIDRKGVKDGVIRTIEIKALGRFTFEKFTRKGLVEFPELSAQATCYLVAGKDPMHYAVKCRDTGHIVQMAMDFPLIGIDAIVEKVRRIDEFVERGELPPCDVTPKHFANLFCEFPDICGKKQKRVEQGQESQEITVTGLGKAVTDWKVGHAMELEAKCLVDGAKDVFLLHCRKVGNSTLDGLELVYVPVGEKVSYPIERLKAMVPKEVLDEVKSVGERADYVRVKPLEA